MHVLREAMPDGGPTPDFASTTVASDPGPGGLRTMLRLQRVGDTRHYDAAGFPGRTVGLDRTWSALGRHRPRGRGLLVGGVVASG